MAKYFGINQYALSFSFFENHIALFIPHTAKMSATPSLVG